MFDMHEVTLPKGELRRLKDSKMPGVTAQMTKDQANEYLLSLLVRATKGDKRGQIVIEKGFTGFRFE